MKNLKKCQIARRNARNEYLPRALSNLEATKIAHVANDVQRDEDRELSLEELKMSRWLLDLAFQDIDDFTGFDELEQSQPAALRYQINGIVYTLAFINRFYISSLRESYLQEAQARLNRKYCKPKVLWYWKYECLWGKLTTDHESVCQLQEALCEAFLNSQVQQPC
jgi:hypothetical protein